MYFRREMAVIRVGCCIEAFWTDGARSVLSVLGRSLAVLFILLRLAAMKKHRAWYFDDRF